MDEDQFFKERADTNIFKQVIYKYLPFWPLFLITTSISLGVAKVTENPEYNHKRIQLYMLI